MRELRFVLQGIYSSFLKLINALFGGIFGGMLKNQITKCVTNKYS